MPQCCSCNREPGFSPNLSSLKSTEENAHQFLVNGEDISGLLLDFSFIYFTCHTEDKGK